MSTAVLDLALLRMAGNEMSYYPTKASLGMMHSALKFDLIEIANIEPGLHAGDLTGNASPGD